MNTDQTLKTKVSGKNDRTLQRHDYRKSEWVQNKKMNVPSTDETSRVYEILPNGDPPPAVLWGTDK